MTENNTSEPKGSQERPQSASNDNGTRGAPTDPRILTIAVTPFGEEDAESVGDGHFSLGAFRDQGGELHRGPGLPRL
jgi:hypothetical protein